MVTGGRDDLVTSAVTGSLAVLLLLLLSCCRSLAGLGEDVVDRDAGASERGLAGSDPGSDAIRFFFTLICTPSKVRFLRMLGLGEVLWLVGVALCVGDSRLDVAMQPYGDGTTPDASVVDVPSVTEDVPCPTRPAFGVKGVCRVTCGGAWWRLPESTATMSGPLTVPAPSGGGCTTVVVQGAPGGPPSWGRVGRTEVAGKTGVTPAPVVAYGCMDKVVLWIGYCS
uniref:Putative secreted protein n=1 Tax=Ixodes ricinus TaxID=34613 RepID=A0A6B0V306_IXORI